MKDKKVDFKAFEEQIREHFQKKYGESAAVEIRSVWKNNGIQRRGLSVLSYGENVTPTIYLEEYYAGYLEGILFEEIAERIEAVYQQERCSEPIRIEYFRQYSSVKDTLRVKLINYERNRRLLADIPHIRILDLALVCCSIVETASIKNGSIMVYNTHMDMWGVSKEELLCKAESNSRQYDREELLELQEVLDGFQQEMEEGILSVPPEDEEAEKMYVLTNSRKMNGAAVLYYPHVLRDCACRLQSDFYLLPSSIHEIILVPAEKNREREFLSMVREVNDEQVAEEEILSYHVYQYHKEENRLEDLVTGESMLMP